MKRQPLVSVIVVCYNAADYIVETLESVRIQTYKNIELIVSDDCSMDGTIDIAKKWLNNNKDRFVRTELITSNHNTGVSANYNRAVRACRGEWVKNVDGDDLLAECCVQENIEFVSGNSEAKWVFSNVAYFEGNNPRTIIRELFTHENKSFFTLDAEKQFERLLFSNILPSQSCFISLDLLKKYPYNEMYKGLEDEPMWITLAKNGVKAWYFDKCTAYYRRTESATSSNIRYFSPFYADSVFKYFWGEKIDYIKELNLSDAYNRQRKNLFLMEFADAILKNRRTKFGDLIYKLVGSFIYRFAYFKM